MTEKKRWLVTHNSHKLKKGDYFDGHELPAWLVGKAIPASSAPQQSDLEIAHTELLEAYESLRKSHTKLQDEFSTLHHEKQAVETSLAEAQETIATLSGEKEKLEKANSELQAKTKKG